MQARSYRKVHRHASGGYTPAQVAHAHNYPAQFDGTGQTIGIISLGGGILAPYLNAMFAQYQQKTPRINLRLVDGARNSPDGPNGADGENYLDIAAAGGTAPGATLNFYLAPNTAQGFLDCFAAAIRDDVDVVSCSWGMPEDATGAAAMQAMDATFGTGAAQDISLLAAAGDNDSGDGEPGSNVDFPNSSPHVLGVGGTSLRLKADGSRASETVWSDGTNGTGGGLSKFWPTPIYQGGLGLPMRGCPDVASLADPATGLALLVDGVPMVIGGTSLATPLVAGLIARVQQALGRRIGPLHPALYAAKGAWCFDVLTGNNGAYQAGPGYDLASGWGVLDGTRLLNGLSSASAPAPVPPPAPPGGSPPAPQRVTLPAIPAVAAGTYQKVA